ncbi:hypothetical protein LGN05_28050 [Burkholderia cenocepacia]|uniref:hypothetical protein n=1 Tax=Burkholderia cenocepacia TaxID=95486 RepID=UPI001CF51130|nr:hypothetical protein [Burkholderia cenocepacia]MCA8420870.1 hypothetical protein [Burkholderia cenocepacia]
MDNIQHHNDLLKLTIEQFHELSAAVREDFGGELPRTDFTECLLALLEDVPGFEGGARYRCQ